MKYIVDVRGERIEVDLDERGVRVGDTDVSAHLADVEGTPVKLVTIGDTVHRVVVERGSARGSYVLWIDGWRFPAEALDERTRTIRDLSGAAAAAAGPAPLVAPMPGLVVRILVNEGAEVVAGQPLVVMEAMKMENELRSASAGTVREIRARAGEAVEKGATLVVLS
ncbi:MAG TPA: biotin/lipoyl-containing protein [Gemmatimonadaceae bacterium]|nr:biotin/lipoyl-containing protein [Gemmatimonadaceae bacterium]